MTLKHVGTQSSSPELRRFSGEAGSEHADSGRTSASTSEQVKFLEINCKFQPGEWLGICAAHAGEASAPRTPHAVLTPPPTPQAALHVPRPRSNRQSRPLTPSPLPPAPPDAPRDPLCISEFVSVSVVLILSPGVHARVKSHGIGLFCLLTPPGTGPCLSGRPSCRGRRDRAPLSGCARCIRTTPPSASGGRPGATVTNTAVNTWTHMSLRSSIWGFFG